MSGLLLHRLPDNQQCVQEDNAERIAELSSSLGTLAEESEIRDDQKDTVMRSTAGKKARPPVAYASVAPFPFLPAPLYTAPWFIVHLDFCITLHNKKVERGYPVKFCQLFLGKPSKIPTGFILVLVFVLFSIEIWASIFTWNKMWKWSIVLDLVRTMLKLSSFSFESSNIDWE
jgi:hypothetical protein